MAIIPNFALEFDKFENFFSEIIENKSVKKVSFLTNFPILRKNRTENRKNLIEVENIFGLYHIFVTATAKVDDEKFAFDIWKFF